MSREIVRLDDPSDFDELMSVHDKAFGRDPGWFVELLPNTYQPTAECMARHYAVRESGRIVAALGAHPLRWHIGGRVLDIMGIGGVGTHPDWRKRGMMGGLLRHVVGEARQRGFHLSWLGGQRQRYRRYGWERAGAYLRIDLSQANVRHEPTMQALPAVTFSPLAAATTTQIARLNQWHDAQPMYCARGEEQFVGVLSNWRAQPQIAHDEQGELIGYAVLDKEGESIIELVGRDLTAAQAMARALVEQSEKGHMSVFCSPLPCELNRWLLAVGENATFTSMGNWQVFDWPEVVGALLAARHEAEPLAPGTVALAVEGESRTLQLTVDGGQPHAEWSNVAPAMTLDAANIVRLLLGPLKPSHQMALTGSSAVLDAWCPLPAAIPHMDRV